MLGAIYVPISEAGLLIKNEKYFPKQIKLDSKESLMRHSVLSCNGLEVL